MMMKKKNKRRWKRYKEKYEVDMEEEEGGARGVRGGEKYEVLMRFINQITLGFSYL